MRKQVQGTSITTREIKYISVGVIRVCFLFPILTNIHGEPTREFLIYMYKAKCDNSNSAHSNLCGEFYVHLSLIMSDYSCLFQTVTTLISPFNPGDYTIAAPEKYTHQDISQLTVIFHQAQTLQQRYINTERSPEKNIESVVEPVFISTLRDALGEYIKITSLVIMNHLHCMYRDIDELYME